MLNDRNFDEPRDAGRSFIIIGELMLIGDLLMELVITPEQRRGSIFLPAVFLVVLITALVFIVIGRRKLRGDDVEDEEE